jgi:hypothetical protein
VNGILSHDDEFHRQCSKFVLYGYLSAGNTNQRAEAKKFRSKEAMWGADEVIERGDATLSRCSAMRPRRWAPTARIDYSPDGKRTGRPPRCRAPYSRCQTAHWAHTGARQDFFGDPVAR